ncbi:MAG: hypothetical protein LUB61_02745 [Eggerthellaceae bacterium]|nr:hypothetical protein [Eggerthellaceae bacterium]
MDDSQDYRLSDLQLMSFYRLRSKIIDFYKLMNLADCLVWEETNLLIYPQYLVKDIVPTYLYDPSNYDYDSLKHGKTGILSRHLHDQASTLVMDCLNKERMFLENTPFYEELDNIISDDIALYPYDEFFEWIPEPEYYNLGIEDSETNPMAAKEEEAIDFLDSVLEKYVCAKS